MICLKTAEGKHIFEDADSDNLAPYETTSKTNLKREYEQIWVTIMSKVK